MCKVVLGRIEIFSLFESEMIKDEWRNGGICNGGKFNNVIFIKRN